MKKPSLVLFCVFLIQTTQAQLNAEFNYDQEVCGNTFIVQDISSGETIINRSWYLNGVLLEADAPVSYEVSLAPFSISDTVTVSMVVHSESAYDSVSHEIICFERPAPFAGFDDTVCGAQTMIEASNLLENGDVNWSVVFGGIPSGATTNMVCPENPNTTVFVSASGAFQYAVINSNPLNSSCYNSDTVEITFFDQPVIYAGDDFDVCGAHTELNAITAGFSGHWGSNSPGVSFNDYSDTNTEIVVGGYGEYAFFWVESNEMCTSMDTVLVTFWRQPDAAILTSPSDSVVCGHIMGAIQTEYPGSGVAWQWWHEESSGNYSPIDFPVSVNQYGEHTFAYTEWTGPYSSDPSFCADTARISKTFYEIPFVEITNTSYIVTDQPFTLTASIATDTSTTYINWISFSGETNLLTPHNVNTLVEYTGETGGVDFITVSTMSNNCIDSDSIYLYYYPSGLFGDGGVENINDDAYPGVSGNNEYSHEIQLSPNPVSDHFSVNSKDYNYPLLINIYTFTGQIIGSYTQESRESLVYTDLPGGQYLIQVTDKNGKSETQKMFISN